LGYPEAELSLVLVGDEEMTRLNREHLGRDRSTNVIAFPMLEGDFGQVNPGVLGDVVMCVDTALREADEQGYNLDEMLDYYLIHGILHLVGYDHEGPAEEASLMEAKTGELWGMLGY